MWIRRVALVALALGAPACGDGAPTQPTFTQVAAVASFLPASPHVFSAGTPPNYVGVWAGQYMNTACRTNVPGFCRIWPISQPVTLRLDQSHTAVTGTMTVANTGEQLLQGYVAEDGAFFSRASDSGFRLELVGDVLGGIRVVDTYTGSRLTRSTKYELSGMRKIQ